MTIRKPAISVHQFSDIATYLGAVLVSASGAGKLSHTPLPPLPTTSVAVSSHLLYADLEYAAGLVEGAQQQAVAGRQRGATK